MQFVADGKGQPALRNQVHLGSDAFLEKMLYTKDNDDDLQTYQNHNEGQRRTFWSGARRQRVLEAKLL